MTGFNVGPSAADPYYGNVILQMNFAGDLDDSSLSATTFLMTDTVTSEPTYADFNGHLTPANNDSVWSDWMGTTQSWTIEFWVRNPSASSANVVLGKWRNAAGTLVNDFLMRLSNGGSFRAYWNGATLVETMFNFRDGNWHHCAFVYNNSTVKYELFIDGVLKNSTPQLLSGFVADTSPLVVGNEGPNGGASDRFVGQLKGLRITTGVARYTSDAAPFTPPSSPY